MPKLTSRYLILLPAVLALAACEARVTTHGYAPNEVERADILPGVDTVFSLEERIGRPVTYGLLDDNTWFYVQTQVEHLTYNPPKVIDRTVVAIDFDEDGVVTAVNSYGLEDGRIINLNTRVTENDSQRRGILERFFGSIGGFSAEQLFN